MQYVMRAQRLQFAAMAYGLRASLAISQGAVTLTVLGGWGDNYSTLLTYTLDRAGKSEKDIDNAYSELVGLFRDKVGISFESTI